MDQWHGGLNEDEGCNYLESVLNEAWFDFRRSPLRATTKELMGLRIAEVANAGFLDRKMLKAAALSSH